MAKIFYPKVISGNDLENGHVIYFTEDHLWHKDIGAAKMMFSFDEAQEWLGIAQKQQSVSVGAYLVDCMIEDGVIKPIHSRELFRANGIDKHHYLQFKT